VCDRTSEKGKHGTNEDPHTIMWLIQSEIPIGSGEEALGLGE